MRVGQQGVTDAVLEQVEMALTAHELVKVRLAGDRDQRREMAGEIARRLAAWLVDTIGRMAILYRPASDPLECGIELPERGGQAERNR